MAKTASIILIGNELLSGRTQDRNLHFIGGRLSAMGIRLLEASVIPDIAPVIVATLRRHAGAYDYVFTTGGIGPTHDDITTDCVAEAFGAAAELNEEAVKLLENHYEPGQLNEARLRMARIPKGASLIYNPISAAPGFRLNNVFVMAGVPSIMQAMFEQVADQLEGGAPRLARTLVLQRPEGDVATALGQLQARHADVEIGSYPYLKAGQIGTCLVARGLDATKIDAVIEELSALARSIGAEYQLMDGEQ